MREIGYYNGKMGNLNEMEIPMQDRALFFGDGVYDVASAWKGTFFALDDHLDRFYRSCSMLEIKFPLTREELKTELQKCLDAAESEEAAAVYWQSSRANCRRSHIFPKGDQKPTLLITVTPMKALDYSIPLKLIDIEDTRFLHCNIKTLNLIPNVLAAQRGEEAGCDEIVFHRGEYMTEGAHSSILILKDGTLIGPVQNEWILPSITRKHIFEAAEELGIPREERNITMDEFKDADEVIVCSTTKICAAADTFNGRPVGMKDRELFRKIQKAYFDRIFRETSWKL